MTNSTKPTKKVAAAGAIGTPLAVVLVWLLSQFDVNMPDAVAASAGALLAAAVGYWKKD